MECRQCASALDRPGDYCLVCRTANADAVVLDLSRDRARVSTLLDDEVVGRREVTTRPEEGRAEVVELRNFAGRVGDEIVRKRPEEVYATGDREVVQAVREQVHYPFYRVATENGDSPAEAVVERRGEPALETVEASASEKIGGRHSTLIGGRDGLKAIRAVAGHPHVKKVVPGPIDAGGVGSQSGVRAKATRADGNGNVRLLVRDGSSVQENRVVTTARDVDTGERVRADLNDRLREADLREAGA